MIGYDPKGLMYHMAHKQEVGDLLAANPDSEEVKTQLQAIAEKTILEKTGIRVGSKAQVCLSSGISLVGGLSPSHNHDDPSQHVTVEVTGIDHWGDIAYVDEEGKENSTYMGMITLCD